MPSRAKATKKTLTTSSREAILNAAERVFASFGYEGASMRAIAQAANVAQALLHYHYQNKDRLFEAVFERRSSQIVGSRIRMLDALFERTPKPTLENLLEVMLLPVGPPPEEDPAEYNMYQQLIHATTVAADARSQSLMARFYDLAAHRFIDALQQVEPGLSHGQAVWAYVFAQAARMQVTVPTNRVARLSRTAKNADPHLAYSLLVPFIASGIRGLAKIRAAAKPRSGTAALKLGRTR